MASWDEQVEAVTREQRRLYELMDHSPREAITEAMRLGEGSDLDAANIELIRAAVLVDAGGELKDPDCIARGVDIFRKFVELFPDRPGLRYNLANGLNNLAQNTRPVSQPWFLATSELRREARSLYQLVIEDDTDTRTLSQAHTNNGNLLAQSYRWAEAYDAYTSALRYDSQNGVAASGLAKVILGCQKRSLGDPEWLNKLAAKYLRRAHASGARIREYAGDRALRKIEELTVDAGDELEVPDLSEASDYVKFVAQNRLALSLTLEGLDPNIRRWDTLLLGSILEDIGTEDGVPSIFAMWNLLKADFLAARWLAYIGIEGFASESGSYSDTLDYARYGMPQSLHTFAQRAAIDLLDKIAVASTEYLSLPGASNSIYFWKRWHQTEKGRLRSPTQWQPSVADEIERGNGPIVALSELAEDIAFGGALNPKKTLRNSSTHRFVVLHDLAVKGFRSSKHVEHYQEHDFERQTIGSLQMARSALLYFVEMIAVGEGIKHRKGVKAVQLDVPPHHLIRGED